MKICREVVLKELEKKGRTMTQMAETLDITKGQISAYLSGSNCPNKRAQMIADYLDISVMDMVDFRGFTY